MPALQVFHILTNFYPVGPLITEAVNPMTRGEAAQEG
jgi:hypothetical protein